MNVGSLFRRKPLSTTSSDQPAPRIKSLRGYPILQAHGCLSDSVKNLAILFRGNTGLCLAIRYACDVVWVRDLSPDANRDEAPSHGQSYFAF
jgi:hypothetical protein